MNEVRQSLCEWRAEGSKLSGVVIKYGDFAEMFGEKETILPAAFGDLSKADVILNRQHQRTAPLARTPETLRLMNAGDTLTMEADLPDTEMARETLTLVKSGVLRGLSIEFLVKDQEIEGDIRIIKAAELRGIGVVDTPAYPNSKVSARHTPVRLLV